MELPFSVFLSIASLVLGVGLGFILRPQASSPAQDTDDTAVKSHDTLLRGLMEPAGFTSWQALRTRAEITPTTLNRVREGKAHRVSAADLHALAQVLHTDMGVLLRDFSDLELPGFSTVESDALRGECERLRRQLEVQGNSLREAVQTQTVEKLQALLVQYPTLEKVAAVKPDFPASNVLRLLTSLGNLLEDWQYAAIGVPWEQTPYDPELHQADEADIAPGEPVYVRFVGYRNPGAVVLRAKVSRTLPAGAVKA